MAEKGIHMKIGILEDNREDTLLIHDALTSYFLSRRIPPSEFSITAFTKSRDILPVAGELDIIFMDIKLPGDMSGIDCARTIRERGNRFTHLIFLTHSRDHAIESYEVSAKGYMLKPVDRKKLEKLLDSLLPGCSMSEIHVISKRIPQTIRLRDILYIESSGRVIYIQTKMGSIKVTRKLDDIERMLADRRFLRCHKSYLVNMDEVESVEERFFVFPDGKRIPMRQRDCAAIRRQYNSYRNSRTTTVT